MERPQWPFVAMADDTPPQTRRLFYALWPDDPVRDALTQLQMGISGRKMRRDNLHLTLAFLGDQPAGLIDTLRGILHSLPKPDLWLTLDRLGYFPRQRIVWAGMHEAPPALLEMHRQLSDALQQAGVTFDARLSFKPHVTLARNAEQPEDLPFAPVSWQASRTVLAQSTTLPEGVIYDVLAST